jgi:hypothetical protein
MNPFKQADIKLIEEKKNSNQSMTEFLKGKRDDWNNRVDDLFQAINYDNITATDFRKVVDSQALALSYQQMLNDETSFFMTKLTENSSQLKMAYQEKFLFYSTGFGLKTNTSEKKILIDAHVSEHQRAVELIETHIDYLRETNKILQSFNYSVKNIISLLDYLGK